MYCEYSGCLAAGSAGLAGLVGGVKLGSVSNVHRHAMNKQSRRRVGPCLPGGRFVPPAIAEEYDLKLPSYEGSDQCLRQGGAGCPYETHIESAWNSAIETNI